MAKPKGLFVNIQKAAKKKNDFAFMMDEENPYEVKEWIDTGCYALNAILSNGDILRGLPRGKRIVFSGGEASAKSILAILMIKAYLNRFPNAKIVFFESEGSSTVDMAKEAGIPSDSMIIIPVTTVEETRTQMVNIVDMINDDKYGYETKTNDKGEKKRKKIKGFVPKPEEEQEQYIFVLDSLGMLGTNKETRDVAAGSDTKDMTRSQLIKGFARVISLKLSMAQAPFIVVNHTYACLTAGHKIRMADGTTKNIEDINIDDEIKILNGETAKVKDTCKYENVEGLVELIDNTGEKITCTPNHKFLISNEGILVWKHAIDINIDDEILSV